MQVKLFGAVKLGVLKRALARPSCPCALLSGSQVSDKEVYKPPLTQKVKPVKVIILGL
jgi:ferredoxin-thioredoxin reductase catalytic subunit